MSGESLIEIAGAGPAGLAAAITAARGGARVVVYERASQVGTRFHGDFQGIENWSTRDDALAELAAAGVAPTFPHAPFHSQVCVDPDGAQHVVAARGDRPFYYLVRRGPDEGTLDRALRTQAEEAGVEIRFDTTVSGLPNGGIVSHGPRRGDAVAVGLLFETDMADGAWVGFGLDVAPGGYAYLLVHGGIGTLSVCVFARFREVRRFLERARKLFTRAIGLRMRNARPFGGTGTMAVPRTARQGNVLLAGEAAGFQDPLWGFGIRNAVVSGHLAARALLSGRPDGYDRAWRARIGRAMRAAAVMRWFYGRLGDRGYGALCRWLARRADPHAALRFLYAPSAWKLALYPLLGRRMFAAGVPGSAALNAPPRTSPPS